MLLRPKPASWLTALLAGAGIVGLALTALAGRDGGRLYEDERDFAAAAANLARHGVLSFAPPGTEPPAPSAYREPAYPALVALAWRLAGATAPAGRAEIEALPRSVAVWRPARALNLALLATAALAAGVGVARAAGSRAGWLAFALVAASPALRSTTTQLMSENLAAAHFALVGLSLLALARGERWAGPAAVGAVGLLPLTRGEGFLLLPVALAVGWLAARGTSRRARRRKLALLALGLSLPAGLWAARNAAATGHPVLSDRGGLALAVRAELDAEIARFGARGAALAWTPLDAARRAAERAAPQALWLDYRPTGPGNFYLRTLRAWQGARGAPGADPLGVDARFGRAAVARFVRHPLDHARAAAAVGWRGLFCEISPGWSHPFDLAFAIGLLLAGGMLVATWRAARGRDAAALALLAPAWVLFGFHVAATELLPRYSTPLLTLAWAALALALAPGRDRSRA